MKRNISLALLMLTYLMTVSQTVVRVRMPIQSENALSVVKLFDESLPTGVSIVLGVVGYEITGGTAPYQYEWLKNNQVIATGEIAVIAPEKNVNYVLRVKDKNSCVVENAINVSYSSKAAKNYLSETVKLSFQQSNNLLNVDFSAFVPENTTVSVYDTQGKLHIKHKIYKSTSIPVSLPSGTYIVVVGNGLLYHVQKIML